MKESIKQFMSESIIRQLYLMRMLSFENELFCKMPLPSNVKQTLLRGKTVYSSVLTELGSNTARKEIEMSEDKLRALSTIFDKLCKSSEEDVLKYEEVFDKHININNHVQVD